MADERAERVAHNEEVFRRANERLRDDWRRLGMGEDDLGLFLCECGDVSCKQPVRVQLADYERVRADADAFLLVPGHEDHTVESIVDNPLVENRDVVIVHKREPQT